MDVCCESCFDDIKLIFDEYGIEIPEGKWFEGNSNSDAVCLICNHEIDSEESYYFSDTIDEEIFHAIEELGDSLSQNIDACFNCEGNEIDYFLYKWNKEADKDEYREKVLGTSVEELLYNHEIPEALHETVTQYLQCKKCRYGKEAMHPKHNPDGGIFELYDEIYTQKEIDEFWGLDYEEFSNFALQYGISLNQAELSDFKKYMIENPLLAFKHPVGQKVYDVLKAHFEAKDNIELKKGQILYRGRNRKVDGRRFNKDEMWSPPKGVSSHGRYNLIGTSVLYCSDKVEGIPLEIHPAHDEKVEIGVFEIEKKLKLLNIDFFENFGGFFSEKDTNTKTLKDVYLLPNFIRDCCYEIGYHGVQYKGVHDEGKYTNYAFFNFEMGEDIIAKKVYTLGMKIKYLVVGED
ncbi:RES domain-containing protein [Bacillus lacus]|uniref:RES domain-containing protein n=1 Tax=Metabacillus lacus TaxID=1983721 RepID=A0A7X2IYD7_9BACI|nr:RES domain-containing protein [Metabacillus lacus]MRX71950.1 RES domain-containing protein [Metabacillus lacus]